MTDPHLLLSGYALDALDPDDVALFEGHLAECEDCHRELAEFGPAVSELSVLTATPAPAQLRGTVLTAISFVRQLDPIPSTDASGSGRDEPVRFAPTDRPRAGRQVAGRQGTGRRILRTVIALAAGLAVVATAALGAWSYGRRQVANDHAADNAAVLGIIGAPDARMYQQPGPNGMRITYVVSELRNSAMAVVQDSSMPANGRTYQLWTVRTRQQDQHFVPDRTFTDPSRPIIFATDIRRAAALGITIEPAGGSPQPTTKPFAVQPV